MELGLGEQEKRFISEVRGLEGARWCYNEALGVLFEVQWKTLMS